MGSPAFVARLQIQRRWRSLVVVALFVAIVGGFAAALIAGARRSSSVVDRYFGATIPYNFQVGADQLTRAQLLAIPGVERADRDTYFASTYVKPDGTLGDTINSLVYDRSSIDPTFRVLEGAIPSASDANAVLVNEGFTEQFGLHSGDTLTVKSFARRDRADIYANHYDTPHGPEYRFRIAAVIRTPLDIALDQPRTLSQEASFSPGGMYVPSAFYDANRTRFLGFGDAFDVELAPSTTERAFEAAARRSIGQGVYIGPARFADRRGSYDTPVDLETTGLLALGVATALAGAIVVALLLGAEARAHEDDDEMLHGLGATRRQLATAALLRTAPFGMIGALLAVAFAYALSARFPIGVGRLLELDRGLAVNAAVLACAVVAVAVFTSGVAFLLASRATRRRVDAPATRARGRIGQVLVRNGVPPEIAVGTHFAFGAEGARRSSTRPAIAGGAIALALVIALGMFLAGTDHLDTDGAAHGWPWDAVIGNTNFPMPKARESAIVRDARVAAATRARYGQATVGGRSAEVLAYDPAGHSPPVLLNGRLPTQADEIAPAAELLHDLHKHVGDRLKLSVADTEFASESSQPVDRELTVVGVSIPPVMGESEFGNVAVVPLSAIRAAGGTTAPQLVLVRLRGPDRTSDARGLAHDYTPEVILDNVPSRIVNLHRVRSLPLLGALIAALFGTVLLAFTLAVAVRRRIRQLGVLRALGMNARRVGRVLMWQGVALALAIVVIGLPLGIAIGVVAWRTFAHGLGVGAGATIPWSLLLLLPGSILVGVLAAVVPARRARRQPVSELLRVE
jgi:hypothetical protein